MKMAFPRRKCYAFFKKLLLVFVLVCCCISFLNLLCFNGQCDSEVENKAMSSLSEVVLSAHKLPSSQEDLVVESMIASSPPNTQVMNLHDKDLDVVKKMKLLHVKSLDLCPKEKDYHRNRTLLVGKQVSHRRYLSVGIPSIGRKNKLMYLKKTITSIFDAMTEDERNNTVVVVFLADFENKQTQLVDLTMMFKKYITMGGLQIIQAPSDYYEPLRDLHRSLGDHMNRVLWRSKQALDYVYLICYCRYLSHYYLQLEDDVNASRQFVSKIADFINSQNSEWISLNVALLGYIGKLYPVRELQSLASYLRLFFNEMPVDWLEPKWKSYRGQDPAETKYRDASLFQHFGLISSFRPKESQRPNTLKEKFFDQFNQKYAGLNPLAQITSDLHAVHGKPSDAYTKGDAYFHARFASAGDKVYDIFLLKETKLDRIAVETGANFAEKDIIMTGTLAVSPVVVGTGQCSDYESVEEFKFGRVDVALSGRVVRCIRINIVYQGRWIYFREVDIWPS